MPGGFGSGKKGARSAISDAILQDTLDDIELYKRILRDDGLVIVNEKTGSTQAHPIIGQLRSAQRLVASIDARTPQVVDPNDALEDFLKD